MKKKDNDDYIKESEDLFAAEDEDLQNKLLRLARSDGVKYFCDKEEPTKVYAFINKKSISLRSKDYEHWLRAKLFHKEKKTASETTFKNVIATITATITYPEEGDPKTEELSLRVASNGKAFYYDLYDGKTIIEIKPNSVKQVPVTKPMFKSSQFQLPQKIELKDNDGSLDKLVKLLEFTGTRALFYKVLMVTRFIPDIPQPFFIAQGSAGSGKSTCQKYMKWTVDRCSTEDETLRNDTQELAIFLSKTYLPQYDNVGKIKSNVSDFLCKVCTGGSQTDRTLYTNEDSTLLKFKRPMSMTCITLPTLRADFIDRSFIFWMDKIDESKYKEQVEMDAEAEQLIPSVLGECLHILSKAMEIHVQVKKEFSNKPKPRLSDFAIWGESVSRAMGNAKNAFFDAYIALLSGYNMDIVQQYLDIMILMKLVDDKDIIDVTPTELLQVIKTQVEDKDDKKELPKQPNTLSEHINEVTPNLVKLGYRVKHNRESVKRSWTITKIGRFEPAPSTVNKEDRPSSSSQSSLNDGHDGHDDDNSKLQMTECKKCGEWSRDPNWKHECESDNQ